MEDTKEKLEKIFRKCSVEKLSALLTIAKNKKSAMTTTTISGSLDQRGKQLGAIISSLTRTKIDDKPLLVPVGRKEEGVLWRLNQDVAPKNIVKELVVQILEENKEYHIE